MKTHRTLAWIPMLVAFGAPFSLLAHSGYGAHGWAHPFMGLDHLLAALAFGLWGATQSRGQAWKIGGTYLAAFLGGGVLGAAGLAFTGLATLGALGIIAVGCLTVFSKNINAWLGILLAGGLAGLHGLAHGTEMTGFLTGGGLGMAAATGVLLAAGYGIGRVGMAESRRFAPFAGLATVALGLALLAL